jgi:hypothetical protein
LQQTVHVANLELHENMGLSAFNVLAAVLSANFQSRVALHLENLALRRRLGVMQPSVKRPRLTSPDRLLWVCLCEIWTDWRSALVIVKPQTVIAWHRKGFRLFWTWKIRRGRPVVPKEVRQLIRQPCRANPLWGAPRIQGELLKLGIDIGEKRTVVGRHRVTCPPA